MKSELRGIRGKIITKIVKYTRYWYIWDSLNGTLDKIGHGTWDNVYWVTKNEGTGMALKTMGH